MAKVIYYISPFDDSKKIEGELSGTVFDILKALDLENSAVAMRINGFLPDSIPLEYLPEDDDLIEIMRPVDGDDGNTKQNLATVVQIAALVVATILSKGTTSPYLIAAIVGGGSIVAGALNKRALELLMGEAGSAQGGASEVETATNAYSVTGANNEAKPLRPLPLLMGSHRYAPDVHCQDYKSIYGQQFIIGDGPPVYFNYFPGIVGVNGAAKPDTTWIPIPANFFATNLPPYPMMVEPSPFGYDYPGPLTPTQISNAQTLLLNYYNSVPAPGGNFWNFRLNGYEIAPLVVYHSSPSDPYYRRYNFFATIQRAYYFLTPPQLPGANDWYTIGVNAAFNGSLVPGLLGGFNDFWFTNNFTSNDKALIRITPLPLNYFSLGITAAMTYTQAVSELGSRLLELNQFNYSSSKTLSYQTQIAVRTSSVLSVLKEGIEYTTQTFNYGLGDLEISDRLVGSLIIETPNSGAGFSPVDKNDWSFPFINLSSPPYFDMFFYQDVLAVSSKKLINTSFTEGGIDLNDQGQYNFSYFEGQPLMDRFSFTITGQLYATNTTTGFVLNSCQYEVQYKKKSEVMWKRLFGIRNIFNDNTKKITYAESIELDAISQPIDPLINDCLQVRIRKLTLDSNNNDGAKICNLHIDHIRFYRSDTYSSSRGYDLQNAPMNLEGLGITALVSDSAQTNKFTAMVESKCWVYDFDTEVWSWQKNRNPAFWFLYFAYGGFKNMTLTGLEVYPYSPTKGWVNYPGHPGNTEHLFGVGLTNDELDLTKIIEWGAFCADNNLNMDLVFSDNTNCADTLERIANCGRGSVTYYNGVLSVVYEDPQQLPTCLFGMGNIIAGSFSVDYAVGDSVREVIGKYVDRGDWESKEVSAIVPYSDAENLRTVEINLEGITDPERAQREVNILAARQFYQRRVYSWSVDLEGLVAKRGDVVYLSHDSTQYGFSGRVKNFIMDSGVVRGIETPSILDTSATYVTVRAPDGSMASYECEVVGSDIMFVDVYPPELASSYIDVDETNLLSDYANSIPEDFIFIAGAKETPGKLVRISEITANEDMSFGIRAVDEDPAMWAYEYDEVIPPESFDNAEVVLSVTNIKVEYPAKGLVTIYWESINGDFIEIINEFTGLPIEANGAYSFTGGKVTLELNSGSKYTLVVKPFSIGTPFKATSKRIVVWPT